MSLIFKALQRFRQPGVVSKDANEASTLQRKGYAFSRVFLAPAFLVGAAAALIVVGFFIYHNIAWFFSGGRALSSRAEAAQPETTLATGKIDPESMEMENLPEPDLAAQPPGDPAPVVQYQFHSPEDKNPSGFDESASIKSDQLNDHPHSGAGRQAGFKAQVFNKPVPVNHAERLPSFAFVARDPEQPPYEDGSGKEPGGQLAYSEYAGPNEVLPQKLMKDRDNPVAKYKQPVVDPPDHLDPIRKQQQQATRATRHLKITRLVDKIHSAIRTDEVEQAARLLEELVQLKGPKDPFVNKLKAYSYIQQSRLEEARILLMDVLSQDADDLEAGLNMAVIDIRSGRYKKARSRLTGLQAIYPEQDQVAIYLRQLPR